MRSPLAVLVIALLAGVLLAGCGGAPADDTSDFSGAEKEVAGVIEDLQAAADEDAPKRVCDDLLAQALTRELGDRCPQAMAQAFDDADTSEIAVQDVRISGATARARITVGTEDDEELLELVREGDVWRIARFAGPVQS
jgi:hypothetical protein